MPIDLASLGPAARRQVMEALTKPKPKVNNKAALPKDDFDSKGERDFYDSTVLPLMWGGKLERCELHREFELYPASDYCGYKLPRAVFKPDFILYYKSGTVEVVEIKSKFTRRQSRDYTLRRRLFIELYARPNKWLWREIITDKEDKP